MSTMRSVLIVSDEDLNGWRGRCGPDGWKRRALTRTRALFDEIQPVEVIAFGPATGLAEAHRALFKPLRWWQVRDFVGRRVEELTVVGGGARGGVVRPSSAGRARSARGLRRSRAAPPRR